MAKAWNFSNAYVVHEFDALCVSEFMKKASMRYADLVQ